MENEEFLELVEELLDSGDDTGCDGLVVVGLDEFVALQKYIEDKTGVTHGCIYQEIEEDDEE